MHLAILGATGAVGRTMLEVLAASDLPVERITLLASERSVGQMLPWRDGQAEVSAVRAESFAGVDVALFSAGAERSLEWAPVATGAGATVVDNSSAWRMDPRVPLVVPEVNADELRRREFGIVANPNCSTIQLVLPLRALQDAAGLRRVVATTFQAVSGAGEGGREALRRELNGERATGSPFPRPIAGNVIPLIGEAEADGWTTEERKMMRETRKILGTPDLPIAATCVRVPVDTGHSIQVLVETERPLDAREAAEAIARFEGIRFHAEADRFPVPLDAAGRDEVLVGRLRSDPDQPAVLHFWVVANNLRKGAATNAVQILERLILG
jgi:aspartate-semialdehyde dehydrogenase